MADLSFLKSLSVYIAASFIICALFIWDYASAYGEVFSTATALANSPVFPIVALNSVIAYHCLLWKVIQGVFFGKLCAAELVALKSNVPFLLAECAIVCLLTGFVSDFAAPVLQLLTFVARLLHCLSEERLVTLSTLPAGSDRARKVGRLGLFLVMAVGVDYCASAYMLDRASYEKDSTKKLLYYYLAVIYIQLSISDVRQSFKLLYQQLVEDRTSLFFFVEKFFEIVEPLVVLSFFLFIWIETDTAPGLLVHSISKHAVGLWVNVTALHRYIMLARRVKCLADATEEDLARDPACTICYDQMELGQHCKVLPCGHVYHNGCLRHWFETRGTCPYCRANVLQVAKTGASPAAAAAAQPAAQPETQQEQQQQQPHPQEPAAPHHEIHEGDQGGNPVLTENELLNAYGQYLAFLRQQQGAEVPTEGRGEEVDSLSATAAVGVAVSSVAAAAAAAAAPSPPEASSAVGPPAPRNDGQEERTRKSAAEVVEQTSPLRAPSSPPLSANSSPKRYLATDRRAARTEIEKAFDTYFAEVEEAQNRLLEDMEAAFAKR